MTLDDLARELQDISDAYAAHFAGQSRATRSLPALDRLIGRLEAAVSRAEGDLLAPGGEGPEAVLQKGAQAQLYTYRLEREAIAAAQAAGPAFEEAGEPA